MPERTWRLASASAPRGRRRQHTDGFRALRRRAPRRPAARDDRGAADRRRARRPDQAVDRSRRGGRDLPLLDRAGPRPGLRGVRRELGPRAVARARARDAHGDRRALRRPARGRPDRVANAVAARHRYGAPCIVVDFGTSTNFDVVSEAGEYVGGVLAPGIEVSMDALFARAARLFRVEFVEPPTSSARRRAQRCNRGSCTGSRGRWMRSCGRIRDELGAPAQTVATGGLAELIAPHAATLDRIDPGADAPGIAPRLGAEPGAFGRSLTVVRAHR